MPLVLWRTLIKATKMHPFLNLIIFRDYILEEDSVLLIDDAMTLPVCTIMKV